MNFLAPLFLIGGAAAAIPIILHLLKREPEVRLKFAAVRLLRHGPVEQTQRRRLRELLLLALRVAAILLLALAFARPYFASGSASESAGVTVVALDTSLSFSAPGRFERARELAKAAIDRVPSGDLAAVITFADEAVLAAAPSLDRSAARLAVDAATPGFGRTRYRPALARASELMAGRRGTIVVVSDLQQNGWDSGDRIAVPQSAQIDVIDVGIQPANLAVTSIIQGRDRIVAVVRSVNPANGEPREARVRLTVDDRPAGEGSAIVGANQAAEVRLPSAKGTLASVSVDDPGGVQGDNTRYLVLGAGNLPSLLVVTGSGNLARDAFYVQQALAAAGAEGSRHRIESVSAAQLSTWDRARLASHAALLLLSTRGLERAGRDLLANYLQEGGGLLLAAGPEIDGEVVTGALGGRVTLADPPQSASGAESEKRAFTPIDPRHPLFRGFGANLAALSLPTFARVVTLRAEGCQPLARFTGGETALLDCSQGAGRALFLASDLDGKWNDFPRHASFVPFLHEAVRYLAGPRPRAGEYLIGNAPADVPPSPGVVTRPGTPGTVPQRVAVNVDPDEADPARLSVDEFQTSVTRMQESARQEGQLDDAQREEGQRLWQYLLGLLLLAMIAETLLAARTA
jgi:hypothetical protein